MQNNCLNKKLKRIFSYSICFFLMCSTQYFNSCGNKKWTIEYRNNVKTIKNNIKIDKFATSKENIKIINKFFGNKPFNSTDNSIFGKIIWMDFDTMGNIYVLDAIDQKIVKISPALNIKEIIGRKGRGPGELLGCKRFTWCDGRLYCANSKNARIEVFTDNGVYQKSTNLPDCIKPTGIHFLNGKFFVGQRKLSNDSFRLFEYDKDFKLLLKFYRGDDIKKPLDVLRQWSTTRVCPDGFWLIFYQINLIKFISVSGQIVFHSIPELDWLINDGHGNIIPEYPVHGPADVDPEGYLYVIYNTPMDWRKRNDVFKYSPDGRLLGKAFTLPIEGTTMLRFDRNGYFYFSNGINLYKAKIIQKIM